MAKFKVSGFDEFKKQLDQLSKKVKKVSGKREVPMSTVLNSAFLRKHTRFSTFDEMMEASGFKCETEEDFDNIPVDEFDKFISSISHYPSWEDMLGAAVEAYYVKELDL